MTPETIVQTLGFKLLFRQFEGWGFDGHELWGEGMGRWQMEIL